MTVRWQRGTIGLALVALLSVGLAAPAAEAAEALKVGFLAPLSGPGAPWGQMFLRGAKVGVDEVNAKGGVTVGGKAYQFQLVEYDDKYTGPDALAVANKLVFEDKARYVLGSLGSVPNLAILPVINANKVLHLAGSAAPIVSPDNPYTFRMYTSDPNAYPLLLHWVFKNRPQVTRVALIVQDDQSGKSIEPSMVKAIKDGGKTLADTAYHERAIKDFFPILTKLKASNPDLVVFVATTPGAVGAAIKQMRQLGMKSLTVSNAIDDLAKFIEIAGGVENVQGHVYTDQINLDATDPVLAEFKKKFKEKHGREVISYLEAAYYDAVLMLAYAMEKAQSTDPEKLVPALKDIADKRLVLGPVRFGFKEVNGNGQERIASIFAVEVKEGKRIFHPAN